MTSQFDVEQRLRDALQPVLQVLSEIDREIGDHQRAIAGLRKQRTKASRIANVIGEKAERRPKAERHQGHSIGVRSSGERDEKKRRMLARCRELGPHVDLTAGEFINGNMGEPPISAQLARDLLRELHDEGQLALRRTGQGGMQVFRLVEPV